VAGMVVVPLFALSAPLASVAGWFAYVGAEGLVRTANLVAYAPFVTWRVAPPALTVSALYYVGGLAAWCLWWRRVRLTGSAESIAHGWLRRTAALVAAISG